MNKFEHIQDYFCQTILEDLVFADFNSKFEKKFRLAYLCYYESKAFKRSYKHFVKHNEGFRDSDGNSVNANDVLIKSIKTRKLPLPPFIETYAS